MKILYVVHQFFPLFHTGSERLTLDTAKQIQRMGHFVSVLTYEPNPPLEDSTKKSTNNFPHDFKKLDKHLMKKEYQVETIPVIAFKYTKPTLGFRIFDPNMEKHMYDIVKKFDLVHFSHPMFFCSALKACKKLGIPTVLTLSDMWLLSPRSLVTSDYELCDGPKEGKKCMKDCHYDEDILTRYKDAKFFFDNVDRVFASSYFGRRTFLENGWKRKMDVIHYSRDYSNVRLEGEPKETVFGFMGSLIWHKGVDVLIKAFKKVQNEKIKLKIYGRGDEHDPYLKHIQELAKDDNRIEFSGTFVHEDLGKIMKEFSVVVVPSSYRDNFPLVMQESLAHLKPLIGSKNGGIPEAVNDGINGYLFNPGNVDQLTKIIQSISDNPEIIKKLKDGIKLPPRIEAEALRYENVYRELFNKTKSKNTVQKLFEENQNKVLNKEKNNYKILLLSHNLNYEGAPRWMYFLSTGLKKFGYQITVASPLDGPLKIQYLKEDVDILVDPKFQREENVETKFFEQFDLIILNTIVNSIFVEKINKIGVPVILSIHESERDVYKAQGFKEMPIKTADKVTFVANATKKVYSDLETDHHFRTIYNAVNTNEIKNFKNSNDRETLRKKYGFSSDDKAILIVGTVIPRKGQMVFAEAAIKLLDSRYKKLHFFIVGAKENDYVKKIRKKIEEKNYSDKIQIIPVIDELFEYYLISDIFICCSFVESFPTIILEAMAFGLPIISTDVFGIPEQIEDGKHGILLKPGDPNILAKKIEFLLENPELGKKYAKNAFARLEEQFSLEKMIRSYDNLIKETINEKIQQNYD